MKTKLAILILLLALGSNLYAQGGPLTPASSSTGAISTNSASCFAASCVVLHMATSNVGYSVTISGTWTGTLTIEQSGDNQATWTSVTTTTANTLYTSALTPGITDARVRGSAAMTGSAAVTITASGPATVVNQIGGTSSGGGITSVSAGQLDPTQAPYNVKADAITGNDGSSTNGIALFTSANQSCSAGDAGKLIVAVNHSTHAYIFGTGLATVTGCSGTSWTTSVNANNSGTEDWGIGTADGAALVSAYAAAFAARKTLAIPCGNMIVEVPPFVVTGNDPFTQNADISGCIGTNGSHFILHPNIVATLGAGGQIFASFFSSSGTGFITLSGLGGQSTISNIFLTSLGGQLPTTAGQSYNVINGFNGVYNVVMQSLGFASSATVTAVNNASGESHFHKINLQNFVSGGTATINGVSMNGQGPNTLDDSILAFNNIQQAVTCTSTTFCNLTNNYITQTQQGVVSGSGATVVLVGNSINVTGGGGTKGAISDNGAAATWYVFGNVISANQGSFATAQFTNSGTVVDMSGTQLGSNVSGFSLSGTATFNDRAGNSFSGPLTQFTGKYVPIGGGSAATNSASAATNFGANLTTQTIVAASPQAVTYDIKIGFRQTTLGVGCSVASNTVNGVLSWTSGGVVQSTGSGGIPALGTLTISGVGATGTSNLYTSIPVHADINTAITFVTTSVLASTGCSTIPQYVVDFSNI